MYKFISLCCAIVFIIGLAACSQGLRPEPSADDDTGTGSRSGAHPVSDDA